MRHTLAALTLATLAGCHSAPVTTGNGTGTFPTWSDGVAACQEEDGSTPGQPFPCRWEAAEQGNGHGLTYTLTAPGETSP